MSTNSQIFPQQIYPAAGDVISTPGSAILTVDGIQNTAVSATKPNDGQTLVYRVAPNQYAPESIPANRSIQCNGIPVSDDYDFYCNGADVSTNQVNSHFPPNGAPVYCNGVPVP